MLQNIIILILMFYMHVIDDYILQGVLAKMKQEQWWRSKLGVNFKKYRYDYIVALFWHSLSWSISISIPAIMYCFYRSNFTPSAVIIIAILANTIIHMIVDHMKANMLMINLLADQIIHMLQVIIYWILLITVGGM